MRMFKTVGAVVIAGWLSLSVQALVVDQDMTITAAPGGVEFVGDYTLTVEFEGQVNLGVVTNRGHRAALRLNSGKAQVSYIEGQNGSYTRVEFNGGILTDAGGWGSAWFKPDATSTIELASIDGNPISITHPNSQWKYLVTGAGRVFTTGSGRMDIDAAGVYSTTVLYCYMNIPSTNYLHTGGACFRGTWAGNIGNVRLNDNNCLPPGEIQLGDAGGNASRMSINCTQQIAHRIVGYGNSAITNMTASTVTLLFTNDHSCLDAVLQGAAFNVAMSGTTDSDVFTLKTPRVSGKLSVIKGRTVVQPPRSGGAVTCGQLQICAGTALEVDGTAMTVGSYENEGGTVTFKNGGTLTVLQPVETGTTMLLDTEGLHLSGCTEFLKSGAGKLCLSGHVPFAPPMCHVAAGTVQFVGPKGTTNSWWRFTVRQSAASGGTLSIGPVRLLDVDCNFADGAGTGANGGGYSAVSAGVLPTAYRPKQYFCTSTDYVTSKSGSDTPQSPVTIWNSSTVFDCTFNSPKPKESDPSTWITWTYRIPVPAAEIRGYNLKTQWGNGSSWPRSWKLESSPSGADGTWVLMDERSGYSSIINGQQWYNNGGYGIPGNDGHPSTKITFDSLDVAMLASRGGISSESVVRVDRGAVLDCSLCETQPALGVLEVDCADGTGVGTLKNVKLSGSGVVRLLNATGKGGDVLPLAFIDSVTTGSLAGWTVYVDGVENPNLSLAWQDGQLVIPRPGSVIIVR